MFLYGNFMLSPGMAVRHSLLKSFLPLSLSQVLIQDYALWVKIFATSNVAWTHQPVVYYRRIGSGGNISVQSERTQKRYEMEESQILDVFLDIPVNILTQAFNEDIKRLNLPLYSDTLSFVLGRIALMSERQSRRNWGYRMIVNFIQSNVRFRKAYELYGFDYKMLLEMIPDSVIENVQSKHIRKGVEKLFYKLFRHFEKRNLRNG
jgi:hypothetical protein